MKIFALVVTALCVFSAGCGLDTEGLKPFGPGNVGGMGEAGTGIGGRGVGEAGSGSGGTVGSGGAGSGGAGSGGSVGSGGAPAQGSGGAPAQGSGGASVGSGGAVVQGSGGAQGTGGSRGGWTVTFTCSHTPDGLTAIQTWQIVNAGGPAAAKSDFVLRAWFTNDGSPPTQPLCDSFAGSPSGCGAVRATILSGSLKRPAADSMLEVGFSGDVTELIGTPGAMFGALETSYHNVDWAAPNLLNDYSCTDDGRHLTAFQPWSLVGLYYRGKLVWGMEP